MNISTKKNAFNNEEIPAKVIRKMSLARQILNVGGDDVRIIDLKPDKLNKERTVAVFRNDDKFQEVFSKVLEDNQKKKNAEGNSTQYQEQINELSKTVEELTRRLNAKE